jgi:quinoprotein glucose dehydrogenase
MANQHTAASVPVFRPPRLFAALQCLIGVILCLGGGWLLTLHGSAYYLCAGVLTLASGILLWNGRGWGSLLYGLMLVLTLLWALWESGADGWALAPRLIFPGVLGLWLLTPWARRGLDRPSVGARALDPAWGGYAAVSILVVFAGCALISSPNTGGTGSGSTVSSPASQAGADSQWSAYGGTVAGARFSTLDQLTPQNVSGLELAWTFRTGPTPKGPGATLEVTPLEMGNSVYLCNGGNTISSLNAETGALRWRFDPHPQVEGVIAATCRGVAFYEDKNLPEATVCAQRIVTSTIDAKLWAVDAKTGQPCAAFGQNGSVDLKAGLGDVPGDFEFTSAPMIVSDRIILGGGWFTNNDMAGDPVLAVRAFDARTGQFIWAWNNGDHGLREPLPVGQKYVPGTPNAWAPMAADEKLGLVYVPSGNATPDYWGGERTPESERYTSSVVALDIDSGDVRWSFQTTHHDLWDYDTNSQPSLADLNLGRGVAQTLIQGTKRGEIFVLDRATGKPLLEVQEKPVPQGLVAGEHVAATQPFSVGLPSFAGPTLTESAMWGITPFDQMWCRIKFKQARYEGPMTPPGTTPSIEYPGYKGGLGWGGVSVDLDRELMVVSTSRIALYAKLIPREAANTVLANLHGVRSHMQTQIGAPYAAEVAPFLSPIGVPCQQPPYGMLSAVDMKTQQVIWTKPFGTAQDSGPLGFESHLPLTMGVPNDGAAITTRGGLTFIGATQERAVRAFDTRTGQLLWKERVPAGPQATPMTYLSSASGRQFVVIAAGGHPSMRTKPGDYILAYALPQKAP